MELSWEITNMQQPSALNVCDCLKFPTFLEISGPRKPGASANQAIPLSDFSIISSQPQEILNFREAPPNIGG
jgi:hypothetical protein